MNFFLHGFLWYTVFLHSDYMPFPLAILTAGTKTRLQDKAVCTPKSRNGSTLKQKHTYHGFKGARTVLECPIYRAAELMTASGTLCHLGSLHPPSIQKMISHCSSNSLISQQSLNRSELLVVGEIFLHDTVPVRTETVIWTSCK